MAEPVRVRRLTDQEGQRLQQTRALHIYLRWRNADARHRDVLAVERTERACSRREKGIRWGECPLNATA
ncbi:hypothetical protein GCM10010350_73690 [Streptomyces galilaeus]|nr:hypothetical protein GCM10010350_73690 [Streptomyces galilaeus]